MKENGFREQMIGHYRLIEKIGEGGFARVYLGQNAELEDRVVAIKILHAKYNSPEKREWLLQEARMHFNLKHRYILPFIDLLPHKDQLCLITDYAVNGTLRDRIPPPPSLLPLEKVRTILWQIGQALQYVHQLGCMHLDLKPENILFNAQDEALLADFGLARLAAGIKQGIAGTPLYMAPEQIQGEAQPASDQYALACVAYQLLTGRPPFIGSSKYELWDQHRTKQPCDPRKFNANIAEHMALAILKALAKDPADRHADVKAFLSALGMLPIANTSRVSQKDKEELFDKAEAFLQDGYLEEALTSYNELIKLDPESARAYCGKGDVFMKQCGHELDALAVYTFANTLDPNFLPAHMGVGNAYYSRGDYQEAIEAYKKAAHLAPDAFVFLKIADVCEKCGMNNEALASYQAAIQSGADPIATRKKKIKLLVASHCYSEVVKEHDCIIQISPQPLNACYEKINFLLSIRYNAEAFVINEIFATYEQIIKLKHGTIEIYKEEINVLENLSSNIGKRLVFYDLLIERVPDEIKVYMYYKIAEVLKLLNRSHETPAIYDQIIELAPHDLNAYYEKLAVFEGLKWPRNIREDALATCSQIIKRVPTDLAVHRKKLALLELLKCYDLVESECDQILILDRKCADAYHSRGKASVMLERIYGNRKNNLLITRLTPVPSRYLKALADYEQASQIDPDNPDYRESIKELLKYLKKFNQAEKASQRTPSRHPAISWFLWSLSLLLLPTFVNAVIGGLLLVSMQHLSILGYVVAGALGISIVGVGVISAYEQQDLIRKYHLYNAFILFLPITCFTIGWLTTSLLTLHLAVTISLFFALVIGFSVNAFVYFLIDRYEEQTFVLLLRKFYWAGNVLIEKLRDFVEYWHALREKYKEKAIAAQQAKATEISFENNTTSDIDVTTIGSSMFARKRTNRRREQIKFFDLLSSSKHIQDDDDITSSSIWRMLMPSKWNRRQWVDDDEDTHSAKKNKLLYAWLMPVRCSDCHGKGTIPCPFCKGKKYKRFRNLAYRLIGAYSMKEDCPNCNGEGNVPCDSCNDFG